MTVMGEMTKAIIAAAIALVMIAFVIAACTVNDARERAEVIKVCLERTEQAEECAIFGSLNTLEGR